MMVATENHTGHLGLPQNIAPIPQQNTAHSTVLRTTVEIDTALTMMRRVVISTHQVEATLIDLHLSTHLDKQAVIL